MLKSKSVLFGDIFSCESCKKFVFLLDGKEYTKEECTKMSDDLKPYCEREGVSLLSMAVDNVKCFQCKEETN